MKVVSLLKPDIVINNQIPAIKKEITKRLWKIKRSKMVNVDKEFLEKFYSDYINEWFFEKNIVPNMTEAPIIILEIETNDNVKDFKNITNIKEDIRKIFAKNKSKNSIHVSDSEEAVKKEYDIIKKYFD